MSRLTPGRLSPEKDLIYTVIYSCYFPLYGAANVEVLLWNEISRVRVRRHVTNVTGVTFEKKENKHRLHSCIFKWTARRG